jgi:hypothetical protein
MKILTAIAFLVASIVGASAQVHVDGYYRKDGTYVQPHWRSSPNSTASVNWSTRSNVNPYTDQVGTGNNDAPSPLPQYRNKQIRLDLGC